MFRSRESSPSKSLKDDDEEEEVFDAGCELLLHYQSQWSELRSTTQEAAQVAETVDNFVCIASKRIANRQRLVHEVERLIQSLPDMEKTMRIIDEDLTKTMAYMEELERVIHSKEESIFQTEMRKRFDSQYVLKIHEEKLNREFEKMALSMESEHMRRIRELRISEENAIRAKQESFRRAFEQELMEYKTVGKIRRTDHAKASAAVPLEEIVVEADEDDRLCLEQFLDESSDHSEQ